MSVVRRSLCFGRWTLKTVLDIFLPPLCLSCDAPLQASGLLCAGCWQDVDFIGPPACSLCGMPFAYDEGPEALCGNCAVKRPAFDRSRAVFTYNDKSKHLVLSFKHGDRTEAAVQLGRWLARAGRELKAPGVLIAPIPLHPKRLFKRRFRPFWPKCLPMNGGRGISLSTSWSANGTQLPKDT